MSVELAGILNVTPDSFSDGGLHLEVERAVAAGLEMVAAGARWVDVGGESTRPGSKGVTVEEELRRVIPVIERLAERGVEVSIDTSKHEVARAAIRAGAVVVNDVTGFTDPRMIEATAEGGAGAVVMHMRGTPETMQLSTRYDDVVAEVREFLGSRVEACRAAGVEEVWVDPGIGFGKSVEDCASLIRNLPALRGLGAGLYLGASRKSFLGAITGVERAADRQIESLAALAAGVRYGVEVVRVHDVGESARMVRVLEYIEAAGRGGVGE